MRTTRSHGGYDPWTAWSHSQWLWPLDNPVSWWLWPLDNPVSRWLWPVDSLVSLTMVMTSGPPSLMVVMTSGPPSLMVVMASWQPGLTHGYGLYRQPGLTHGGYDLWTAWSHSQWLWPLDNPVSLMVVMTSRQPSLVVVMTCGQTGLTRGYGLLTTRSHGGYDPWTAWSHSQWLWPLDNPISWWLWVWPVDNPISLMVVIGE